MDNNLSLAPAGDFSCIQGRGLPRIIARVIALWTIPFNPENPSFICQDMILIDRVGSKIQASVCRRHPLLQSPVIGRVYIFSRFRVLPNNDVRFTTHQFRLFFHTCTGCVLTYDVRIPRYGWSFLNNQQIRAQRDNQNRVFDCVGVVAAASDVRLFIKNGRMTKMLVIQLLDPSGCIPCVITGSVVNTLSDYLDANWTEKPIIVLQFARITSFRDKSLIESIPIASKLLINMEIDEVYALTTRMSEIGINYRGPVGYIRSNEPPKNMKTDFIENHPKKSIAQLMLTNQGETCVVYATIVAVIMDGPWYYPSCRCYAELRANGDKFDCLRCGRTIGKMLNRFRFKVEVFDGQESAVFLLFDREAEALTGFSCEELLNTIQSEKRLMLNDDYPAEIEERIHGLELLFKVSNNGGAKNDRYDCFQVLRICTDLDVIAMFHDHDDVETPNQAKYSNGTHLVDTNGESGEVRLGLSGGKRALGADNDKGKARNNFRRKLVIESESDEESMGDFVASGVASSEETLPLKELAIEPAEAAEDREARIDFSGGKWSLADQNEKGKADNYMPRKLIIDFESDEEDYVGFAGSVVVPSEKHSPLKEPTGESYFGSKMQKSLKSAAVSMVDPVYHQAEPYMSGDGVDCKKKVLSQVKIEEFADAASGLHFAADFKYAPSGDTREEIIQVRLNGIQVPHAEVEEVIRKINDDSNIIDISDDEDEGFLGA